jgi:hypothetical protein
VQHAQRRPSQGEIGNQRRRHSWMADSPLNLQFLKVRQRVSPNTIVEQKEKAEE